MFRTPDKSLVQVSRMRPTHFRAHARPGRPKVTTGCPFDHARTTGVPSAVSVLSTKSNYYFKPKDLKDLIQGFPMLKQLAISIPPTCLCPTKAGQAYHIGCTIEYSESKTDLRAFLDAIASASHLHTFRNLNPQLRTTEEWTISTTNSTSFAKTALADQLLKYLHKEGSKIKVLAFSPLHCADERPPLKMCGGGMRWPHFYYVKAKMVGSRRWEEVVARPLVNCIEEMAGSTILGV
ncbi:hypothetical protein K458DRAFT_155483 [Lentithecium fluviatile CBS 122367]|uniref:Uncharacterized protein n=1 Tax=Lentithecium fluviatile CBS 122367 TaxID=1168545 RepID=A0A6G1JEL0_9PLEO|nr:hypothetical protein K458DRAFT_155483 [Lentithecium fluviatile CBS 122367]